jgi:hypothetical protein
VVKPVVAGLIVTVNDSDVERACWVAPSACSTSVLAGGADRVQPSVATILREHVSLSTSCMDRLYLGYVSRLQPLLDA